MAMPEPNVRIVKRANGRFRVFVDGVQVVGVTGVEISQPIKERMGPDGWMERVKDGSPVVSVQIASRMVTFGNDDA